MKRSIYLLSLCILVLLVAACVSAAPAPAAVEPAVSTTTDTPSLDTFPVTLEHKFGTTEIKAEPKRVLSLGYSDQDAILALGIQPIAVRHWFGDPENGVWEWAQSALRGEAPQVLEMPFGELNIETIAALQPDLIVAISAGLSPEEYELLAQIAPVVAIPAEYTTMPSWQDHTRLVGLATGRSAKAEEVIADVEAQIAAVRAAHPVFEGKTVIVAEYLEAGSYYIYDPANPRIRFLNSLGLVMTDAALDLHATGIANATISGERLDLLEADLLIWGVSTTAEQATLEALPLYQNLEVVKQNRDLFYTYTDEPNLISAALAYGTVLSIPYLFETMVPELNTALGGEAAASADDAQCEAGFRFFDHELLATEPTCIPENPERFAYLIYPSYLYALGVKPIAAWGLERDAENYPFIADWITDGIVDHGMPPNLETLIGLKPDLLLYDIRRVADVVAQLQQIAPLVTFDVNNAFAWQDRHLFNAAVFNRVELAEAQIAVYEGRVAELRAAIEASRGDISNVTVSLVRIGNEGVIDLLGPWYPGVSVVQEIGFDLADGIDLTLAEMQARYDNIYTAEISEELIPTVDGDVLIVFGPGGGAQSEGGTSERILNELHESPLWQTLNAVQTDALYFKGDYWLQPSILTAHLVIDELAKIFAVEIATPNPFLTE